MTENAAAGLATFDAGELGLAVASDQPATASSAERTIEGIVVPFGPAGRTSGGLLTFGAGSLTWNPEKPGRVKLLVEHDQGRAVGYAEALEERAEGIWARFKLPEGDPEADRALTQAANGIRDAFSVGVMLDEATHLNLRRARNAAVKGSGVLREVSMVSVPAFDDARVGGSIAASSDQLVVSGWTDDTTTTTTTEGNTMPDTTATEPTTAAAEEPTTAASSTSSPAPVTAASSTSSPEPVRAAAGSAAVVASEPAAYSLDGQGHSLVRDAFNARMMGDHDAADRLRRFNAELAGNNPASVMALTTAAAESTTTAPNVFPTINRPDLMRAMVDAHRPLISQVTTIPLTSANPFTIPTVGEFTGVAEHTEGQAHAAEGDLVFGGDTVTPRATSGAYRITRELIDSSNPILDRIAVRKMLKDYRRVTELKAWTVWTSGLTATASINTVAKLDAELDTFINTDEETADFVALSSGYLTSLKGDVDGDGRPHLARYAPINATAELTGSRTGLVAVFGDTKAIRAGSVTAGQAAIIREAGVLWAESPVQQFTFSEVEGPGIVKLALWGYSAAARLDDADVQLVKFGA